MNTEENNENIVFSSDTNIANTTIDLLEQSERQEINNGIIFDNEPSTSKRYRRKRFELRKYNGMTVYCTARFEEVRFDGFKIPVLLFRNVKIAGIKYDHMWFAYNSEFAKLDLLPNTELEFHGTVVEYDKKNYAVKNCKNFKIMKQGEWEREYFPVEASGFEYGYKFLENKCNETDELIDCCDAFKTECEITDEKNFILRFSRHKTKETFEKGLIKTQYNLFDKDRKINKKAFSVVFTPTRKQILINHKFYLSIDRTSYHKMCLEYFLSVRQFDKDFFYVFDEEEPEEDGFSFTDEID